jgi:acyl-CoA thioester hydrolase
MKTPSPWFEHRIRARYQETDAMGVVYHANYLNWFEISRTEWVRSLGRPYTEFEKMGLMMPVVDAKIRFLAPARYDDLIVIRNQITLFSPVRLTFEYEIRKEEDDTLLVTGQTDHVWINREWRPISLKKVDREAYEFIEKWLSSRT